MKLLYEKDELGNIYEIKNMKVFTCLNELIANDLNTLLNNTLCNKTIAVGKDIYTSKLDYYLVNYNGLNIIKDNNMDSLVSRVDINGEVKPVGFLSISKNFLPEFREGSTTWEYIKIACLVPSDILDYTNNLSTYLNKNICFIYHDTDNSLEFMASINTDEFSTILRKVEYFNQDNNLFESILYYNELGLLEGIGSSRIR